MCGKSSACAAEDIALINPGLPHTSLLEQYSPYSFYKIPSVNLIKAYSWLLSPPSTVNDARLGRGDFAEFAFTQIM